MFTNSRNGSILILTLWTLFFLSALALAVSAHVSANFSAGWRISSDTRAYYCARAGVELAVAELMCDSNGWDALSEPWCNDESLFRDVELGYGSFSLHSAYLSDSGTVVTNYGLVDEERKVNITRAELPLLESLVAIAGETDSAKAAAVAAAIKDWRDADDEALTDGAENSYYAGLNQPYSCGNREFRSPYELLLVRGVDSGLFSKLEPHITVHGGGKINVNTADRVVLACVGVSLGGARSICNSLAAKIVAAREAGTVFETDNNNEIVNLLVKRGRLNDAEKELFKNMTGIMTIRSSCFTGNAEGSIRESDRAMTRSITFVFDRDRRKMLHWHE